MDSKNAHAALEKRHWVRITRRCNNRCLFCLDRDSLCGDIFSLDEVVADLQLGRDRGAKRAILSGGEPTIHPDFFAIVAAAREMGYEWVQTITNGRMFFYRDFARRAVTAGLREATFSLHAHEPALFDELTGIPGSFNQAFSGLKNAMNTRGLVVSVDIVVNKLNYEALPEIVRSHHRLGVTEFDLLFPVPFGGAWLNRDRVLLDPAALAPILKKVLAYAASHRIVVWTNRLPAAALEGFESHIQPPEKMHDEVFGRKQWFLDFLDNATPLPCLGERCDFCNMANFCAALADIRNIFSGAKPVEWIVSADTVERLNGMDPARVAKLAAPCELMDHPAVVELAAKVPMTYIFRELPVRVPAAFKPGDEIEIIVNRATAPALLSDGPPHVNAPIFLAAENYPDLETCLAESTSLKVFFKHFLSESGRPECATRGVPPCLSRSQTYSPALRLPLDLQTPGGAWDLTAITRHFITGRYRVKSARCCECSLNDTCPGPHINYARAFGLRELSPVKSSRAKQVATA